MRLRSALVLPLLLLGTPVVAAEKIEVTRFHTPETLTRLGPGAVEVVAAPGTDGASLETRGDLETRIWLDAVARELAAQGIAGGSERALRVAEVHLSRDVLESRAAGRSGSSVSVGVGAGSGGWRRGGTSVGLGVGLGFPLGGSKDRVAVENELSVTIRDRATGEALWEGRSTLRTGKKGADSPKPPRGSPRRCSRAFPDARGRLSRSNDLRYPEYPDRCRV